MGSIEEEEVWGTIRYGEPDESIPVQDRALYSPPSNKLVKDIPHKLHDFRNPTEFVQGPEGLDVQGFTYVKHEFALSGEAFFEGKNVEEIYGPEVVELICKVTGAKSAVVDGFGLRSRVASEEEEELYNVKLKDGEQDKILAKYPADVVRVPGRDKNNALEPARMCHVDYSCQGLRDTVRFSRLDVKDAAQHALDAEDAGRSPPRYAVYGVWRPIKPVKRDPLAVLDWRTIDKSELALTSSRAKSGVNEEGEFIRGAILHVVPQHPARLRWCYMSHQKPDEVLILKFADTAAGELGETSNIAAHCVHGSASIAGTENEPARESIECRVIAFF